MEQSNTITLPVNDIITPVTVAAWPPAIGWWLLVCLIIFVFVLSIIFISRYRKRWGYRNVALNELTIIMGKASSTNDITYTSTQLMTIIKRVSMTIYPQQNFAMLEGSRFLHLTNATLVRPAFSQATINNIDSALYKGNQNFDIHTFHHECCRWIKHHPQQYREPNGIMTDV